MTGLTLQKSIDLTPLLPSAGPTGGLGLAWPAPTISLTMVSTPAAAPFAFDMAGEALREAECWRSGAKRNIVWCSRG